MIYLDANALVKLVRKEDETSDLLTWLEGHPDEPLVSSTLVEVEVPRALHRNQPSVLGAVATVLKKVSRFEVDAGVRATAAAYNEPLLRSLDAIHLATAEQLVAAGKIMIAFVTYDKRLAAAAVDVGLPVVAPGAS